MADLPDNATVIVQDPAGLQARANLRPPLVSGWPHTLLFPSSLNGPLNGILTPDTVNSRLTLASPYELVIPDGTAAVPSLGFTNDPDTGFYRAASGEIAYSSNGAQSLRFQSNGSIRSASGQVMSLGTTDGGEFIGMTVAGALNLSAKGTNQSITLTPSGTGVISSSCASPQLQLIRNSGTDSPRLVLSDGTTSSLIGQVGSAGALTLSSVVGDLVARVPATKAIRFTVDGGTTTALTIAQTTGNLLLGTVTDSSNGRLQLATHTTSAGGIGFGTDISLFRASAANLYVEHASTSQTGVWVNRTGGTAALGGMYLPTGSNSLRLYINGADALTLDASQNATFAAAITAGGNVSIPAANVLLWTGRTRLWSDSDGTLRLQNAAGTDFSRLQFGGTTSSFPALKRSNANLLARLADDSGYADVGAARFVAYSAATSPGAGAISYGATTATSATAGANGDVPAQVAGYIIINVAGTTAKIPYYNN